MAKKLDLREVMPVTASLIDRFRDAFGAAEINDIVRRGMAGEPVFYASENGNEIGTLGRPGVRVRFTGKGNKCVIEGE